MKQTNSIIDDYLGNQHSPYCLKRGNAVPASGRQPVGIGARGVSCIARTEWM
jgi:hypothetical protein